jgi:hypothetical protein
VLLPVIILCSSSSLRLCHCRATASSKSSAATTHLRKSNMGRTRGVKKIAASANTRGASSSAAASAGTEMLEASTIRCDWSRSTFNARDKTKLLARGLIDDGAETIKFPGNANRPKPPAGYVVMFLAHMIRGFSFPVHEFLRGLLFAYGLELWQLTPNSILHVSLFITLCECFLGIEPNFALWKRYFFVKRHASGSDVFIVGGVGFSVRADVGYFKFPMRESVQSWREKWFYIKDQTTGNQTFGLKAFSGATVVTPKISWKNTLSAEEKEIADNLHTQVCKLKTIGDDEISGTEIVAEFLRR